MNIGSCSRALQCKSATEGGRSVSTILMVNEGPFESPSLAVLAPTPPLPWAPLALLDHILALLSGHRHLTYLNPSSVSFLERLCAMLETGVVEHQLCGVPPSQLPRLLRAAQCSLAYHRRISLASGHAVATAPATTEQAGRALLLQPAAAEPGGRARSTPSGTFVAPAAAAAEPCHRDVVPWLTRTIFLLVIFPVN